MTQRLVLTGKFEKPAGFTLRPGAPLDSATITDYEPVPTGSPREYEEVVSFPPLAASARPNSNTIRFQGIDNLGPFVIRVAYKADDKGWGTAPLRVFDSNGLTPNDAVKLPAGTVAVAITRLDGGGGPVGYVLDLEV